MYALLFVLDDPDRLDEVLTAWADIGVRGVTIMESTGWQRRRIQQSMLGARFDFASLVGGARLENHMTLFVVVENRAIVQKRRWRPPSPSSATWMNRIPASWWPGRLKLSKACLTRKNEGLMVWVQFIVASAILVFAAMQLAKYGDIIAIRTKLGGMFVGTLLLAGATSLPELLTTINSLDQNVPNLAAGNMFGSNMFNMFMLAILDLANQNTRILRQVAMKHALTAGLAILLIGMSVFFIDINQDWKIGWVGLDSLMLMVVYLGGVRLLQGQQNTACPRRIGTGPKTASAYGKRCSASVLPPLFSSSLRRTWSHPARHCRDHRDGHRVCGHRAGRHGHLPAGNGDHHLSSPHGGL
jgi:hypothetical protein